MKDRTPKYPGRVKLEPVAGQTNIFDMTRADEPDDTGTPFNTRTMLQDSTGQFLKLPYANPLVDDALRHMPDRIEPIGTVKTTPALSLGDAWLPCNGSQVTFAEYPQLCQLLRGTVGVEFDGAALGVSGVTTSASDIVYFSGKWWVAICQPSTGSGTNYKIYPITILCSDSIEGPWSVDFTVSKRMYSTSCRLSMACTEDICVLAFRDTEQTDAQERAAILYRKSTEQTWTFLALTDYFSNMEIVGIDVHDGMFALALGYKAGTVNSTPRILYSRTPDIADSWVQSNQIPECRALEPTCSFSYANGYWIYLNPDAYSSGDSELRIAISNDASGFQFEEITVTIKYISSGVQSISKTVFYNNKFYVLLEGYVNAFDVSKNNIVLASTTDFVDWTFQKLKSISYDEDSDTFSYLCALCASEKTLVMATAWSAWSTSDPAAQIIETTLPAGFKPEQARFDGDTAIIVSASSIAYHDFSADTRLLPTISLSDDTTTYIKAKNELDVFEAGGDI